MKVFIVMAGFYEQCGVDAVFSSLGKAQAYIKASHEHALASDALWSESRKPEYWGLHNTDGFEVDAVKD